MTAALSVSRLAGAQGVSGNDAAAAEALFEEGKRLMALGRHAAACPKFAESLRIDVGLGTMLWLADCYDKNGQAASAWAQFREAEALAVRLKDPRAKLAREEAIRLEPKLSRLMIDVPASSDSESVEVRRDGVVIGRALWGVPVPTDAGRHRITATAPGKQKWESVIIVPTKGGASVTVRVPSLAAASPDGAESPTASFDATKPSQEGDNGGSDAPSDNTGATQRVLGVIAGSAGIVGLGVGAFFGLRVASKNDESKDNCAGNRCNQIGFESRESALQAATISTVAFVAGGVLVAGGIVLYLTAPSAKTRSVAVAPLVGAGEAGAGFVGRW